MSAPLQNKISRKVDWLAAALISAAILWLHFYFWQNAGGLWRDEVNLVNLANSSSLAVMTHDSFPVLMPLLVNLWSAPGFGHNDAGLRLLGALIGLGIPVALWAAAWTARRSPPLISLTLLGLNTTLIFYGDSLRAHGLGSALIVLAAAAMWWFLKKPSWSRAAILTVAATMSVQALYQNAVLLAAICFGAWLVCGRRKNWRAAGKILLAGLAAAASLLPYWANIFTLSGASASLRSGFLPVSVFMKFDTLMAFPLSQYDCLWEICAFAVIGFGCAALRSSKSKNTLPQNEISADDLPLFAGATLLAAMLGFAGFLWFAALPTQPWYFLPLAALIAICFDLGLPWSSLPRFVRLTGFGLVVVTALIAVPTARRDLNRCFTNVDLLARQLTAEASPQDFIIVNPWFCGISFDRYFKSQTPWQTLPPLVDHTTHRYDLFREKIKTPKALQPVFDQIAATLQSGHRVWVVGTMTLPKPGLAPASELTVPPLNISGEADSLYAVQWSAQAASFLARHSLQFQRANQATNRSINSYEDLQLLSASGWKTNQP
jgi:hypothetical protein